MRIAKPLCFGLGIIGLLPVLYLGSFAPLLWLRNHTHAIPATGAINRALVVYAAPLRNCGDYTPPWFDTAMDKYKTWLHEL